mmetsp:Transcript_63715/g.143730  ORF Transcript_63715/g.143730 Transcript_63715/m.143730 type:complete len:201 (+) Transcript_63715:446-1048(+)
MSSLGPPESCATTTSPAASISTTPMPKCSFHMVWRPTSAWWSQSTIPPGPPNGTFKANITRFSIPRSRASALSSATRASSPSSRQLPTSTKCTSSRPAALAAEAGPAASRAAAAAAGLGPLGPLGESCAGCGPPSSRSSPSRDPSRRAGGSTRRLKARSWRGWSFSGRNCPTDTTYRAFLPWALWPLGGAAAPPSPPPLP